MTDAAIYFAWAFGLSDWRTAEALGTSENAVRLHRRALGLKKTGGGAPDAKEAGLRTLRKARMKCGAAPARATPRVTVDRISTCYRKLTPGATRPRAVAHTPSFTVG